MKAHDTTLALIAGGRGSRLSGAVKGLLLREGRPLLAWLLDLAPLFEDVLLVANDPAPYAGFGLRTVADQVRDRGAPGGVHAALASATTHWVLAIACDMPFVQEAAVGKLLEARREGDELLCFEVAGRPEPLLGLYRASLAARWADALASEPSFRQLFERFRARLLPEPTLREVDPACRSVQSVNSPEDLARLGISLPAPAPAR